jgi:ribosomal protein S19
MVDKSTMELNKEVIDNIKITSHESMILKSIESFYLNIQNSNIFINIITSDANISIRLIDYFITKYSKLHKISYKYNEQMINIYSSYKQQLKAYQKKHFDPFSRGDRIPYFINDTCIITTIGQLNFFKWFISKNILEYITNNQTVIENEMNHKNRLDKNINKMNKSIKIKKNKLSLYNKNMSYMADNNYVTNTNNNINVVVYFN